MQEVLSRNTQLLDPLYYTRFGHTWSTNIAVLQQNCLTTCKFNLKQEYQISQTGVLYRMSTLKMLFEGICWAWGELTLSKMHSSCEQDNQEHI